MSSTSDAELAIIKGRHYRGIAKVNLQALKFDYPLVREKHRKLSIPNVERLKGIFRRNGCLRLQEKNFINAIIDDSTLQDSLSLIGSSIDAFRGSREGDPLLHLSLGSVECLSGLHRVEAAKSVLDDNDQWWVVKFYSKSWVQDDLTGFALSTVIEDHAHEQKPSDGEIFWKIRHYQRCGDEDAENSWWAYLDHSKPKDLRQLMKKPKLISAFDDLLDMPGLWATIQLGTLHRLLTMKCDEEMIAYLKCIREPWMQILKNGNHSLSPLIIDPTTAKNLESLAPQTSPSDRLLVENMMASKEAESRLFPSVLDENVRQRLLRNICELPYMIPTLGTFFESLKYLEPCCDVLKQLIGNKMNKTIRKSLMGCFFAPAKNMIQVSERYEAEYIGNANSWDRAFMAYVELWAFCARHFDGLTSFTPKKEGNRAKPAVKGPNPMMLQCFAKFAVARGFKTPRAVEIASQESQTQLATEYLQRANPMSTTFNQAQIQGVISAALESPGTDYPQDLELSSYCPPERRCGRPFADDCLRDRQLLFLPVVYGSNAYSEVTYEFIRRDLFTRIFGSFAIQDGDLSSIEVKASWLEWNNVATHDPVIVERDDIGRMNECMDENNSLKSSLANYQNENNALRIQVADLTQQHQNTIQQAAMHLQEQMELQRQSHQQDSERVLQAQREKYTSTIRILKEAIKSLRKDLEYEKERRSAAKAPGSLRTEPRKRLPTAKQFAILPPQTQETLQVPPQSQETALISQPRPTQALVKKDEVNEIGCSLQDGEDLISKTLQIYGSSLDPTMLRGEVDHPEYEVVFLPERKGLNRGVRIAISDDEEEGQLQIAVLLEHLELYICNSGSNKVIRCATTWQVVNKNKQEVWGACSKFKRCYIGSEEDLFDWKGNIGEHNHLVESAEGFVGTMPPDGSDALIDDDP